MFGKAGYAGATLCGLIRFGKQLEDGFPLDGNLRSL
jgi:hypothetical protein